MHGCPQVLLYLAMKQLVLLLAGRADAAGSAANEQDRTQRNNSLRQVRTEVRHVQKNVVKM